MVTFNPGQVLEADDLNAALGIHRYKTADETISATTTLQNDDHLFAPVEANAVYSLYLTVLYQSGTTPDFKQAFTAPAGTTFESSWFLYNPGTVALGTTGALGSVTGLAGTAANVPFILSATVFVGGTAGTVQWQWAQNTSDAGSTIVRKGGRLTLIKLS